MKRFQLILFFVLVYAGAAIAQIEPLNEGITGNKIIEDGKEYYLYKVQQSEGFYTIERKFGVSRVEIVEANPEVAQGLKVGQVIKIPLVKGRNSNQSELKASDKYIFHTVEKGQNLFFISRKYGVTVDDILTNNPAAREILIVGTELKIPIQNTEEEVSRDDRFIYHKVNPGETLFAIARTHNRSVKSILEANPGLQSENIPVGSEVRIPKLAAPVIVPEVKEQVKDTVLFAFEDEHYFYHKIKPKETFYAIINQYNVDKEAVQKVNSIQDPTNLKIGYIIKIPKSAIKKTTVEQDELRDKKHLVYKVIERRESVEDIAKKFGVTPDQIEAANTDFTRWGRYKKGDLVKIPVKNLFARVESKPATIRTNKPASQYLRDSLLLAGAFAAGCDTLMYDKPVNVAVLWPFFLEINDTFNIIKEVTEDGDTLVKMRDPLEVYPSLDRQGFREFYQGILVAVDSLKRKGIDLNLYTYDTSNDSNRVKAILERPEMRSMNLIIGPAYNSNIQFVSDFCLNYHIKHIIPYSSADELTKNNPYVFQVNPIKSSLYGPSISFIVDNYKNSNIIVAYGSDKSESIEIFIEKLKRDLFRAGVNYNQQVSFKEVDVNKYGFQGLEKVIDPEKENLVIIPPELTPRKRLELFNKVVPTIENLVNKRKMKNITLFGYPDLQKLPGRELKMVFNSNTILYTPFYVDFNNPGTQKVINLFRSDFYTDPGAEYPYYGLLGFDIAFYFISAVHEFGPDFEQCLPYLNLNLTTSGFNFQRANNWSGMVNTNINFLNYTREFDITRIDYKPSVAPLGVLDYSSTNP